MIHIKGNLHPYMPGKIALCMMTYDDSGSPQRFLQAPIVQLICGEALSRGDYITYICMNAA